MTQTPNIGLKKIDGSENWRNVFDYHNDSMDLADEAIAGVRAGLTYVENGDTIAANAAYTEGKFICWKGEIYRIRTTINTTVTSSNWTTYLTKQDGIGGALSQINGDLASLNSKITPIYSYDLGTTIFQRFKSAHEGVGVYTFYIAPSDIPSGQSLSSWYYSLITFKANPENQVGRGDYCLLFYPGMMFMGEMAADANSIVWRKVSIA